MPRVHRRPVPPPPLRAAAPSTGAATNATLTAALTSGLTPAQSHDAALALSQKLVARQSGSTAEIALLLFHAVNSAESATGAPGPERVPADVQRAVREVLLALKLRPVDLKAIQDQFLRPLGDDLDEAAVAEAYEKLAASPEGFDAEAVRKLMALAWTGGRVTLGERGGIAVVLKAGAMAESARADLRVALMDALLASLQPALSRRAEASALVDELLTQAAVPSVDGGFFARGQEAFFSASTRPGQLQAFAAAAGLVADASPLELELARRLTEDARGQLHLAGLEKLLTRIKANGSVTATEQAVMDSLGEDPDGRAGLVRALRALPVLSEPLLGRAEALLDGLSGAAASATASQGLAVLGGLAKRTNSTTPLPAPQQAALVEAWGALLATQSPEALDAFAVAALAALRGTTSLEATLAAADAGWLVAPTARPNPNPPTDPVTRGAAVWEGGWTFTPVLQGGTIFLNATRDDGTAERSAYLGGPSAPVSTAVVDGKVYALAGDRFSSVWMEGTNLRSASLPSLPQPATPPPPPGQPPTTGSGSPPPPSAGVPPEQQGYQLVNLSGTLYAVGKGTAPTLMYDRQGNTWETGGPLPRDLGPNPLVVDGARSSLLAAFLARDGSQPGLIFSNSEFRDLPELPAFTAESATIQEGTLYVSGTSASGPRKVVALKLDASSEGWKQVSAPAALNIVLDRSNVLVAQSTSDYLQKARLDLAPLLSAPGAAALTLGPANIGRLQALAGLMLDGLSGEPVLEAAAVKDVLDVLATLKRHNALSPALRAQADAVFLDRDLTPESAALLGEQWYGAREDAGARVSTVDSPRVAALRDRAVQNQPMLRQDLLHLLAASHVLDDPSALVETLPADRVAPDDVGLINAELTRGLARSVDALLRRPAQSLAQVQEVLDRAKRLASGDARSAFIDLQVRRLLIFGKPAVDALPAFRAYLGQVPASSEAELRLAAAWFQREGGGIATRELRALAALTDSDGVRTPGERAVIESLDWRALRPGARGHLPTLTRGVTAAEDLAGGDDDETGARQYKVDATGPLAVWAAENRRASDGKVVHVGLEPAIGASQDGLKTNRVHVSGKAALATAEGQEPFPVAGSSVTADGFDQVQALWTVNHVLERLASVGVDVPKLLQGTVNGGNVRVKVNAFADQNAFYSPVENQLAFGTANESWHLASDSDIVAHEMGHYVLDHLNPNLIRQTGDGASIHEGFGDALAALLFADPELAEDWGSADGPEGALRTSKNSLKLSDVSRECHDRGQVYAGFLWSTWERLAALAQDDALARDWMIGIMVTHPLFYGSSDAKPEDFVGAMMKGAAGFLDGRAPTPIIDALQAAMKAEGVARGLVEASWTLPVGAGMAAAPGLAQALRQDVGVFARLDAKDLLSRIEGYRPRPDVTYEIVSEQEVNRLRKFTVQAKAVDVAGDHVYPIEDGFVTAVYEGNRLADLGGRGRFLPQSFDFTEPPFGWDEATSRAKDYARSLFQARAAADKDGSYVLNNLDRIFDSGAVRREEVVSGGQRARKVITEAGEFIVRSDGAIEASRVGHHD